MSNKNEEGKDMSALFMSKPIPKTQIGLNNKQKDIMKSLIGKAPKFPISLNTVRDWEKNGEN